MKWHDPIRDNQLRLQEEARKRGDTAKRAPRRPWRDIAYGKLRGWVSVSAMDAVIWSIVALIALSVIVGLVVR